MTPLFYLLAGWFPGTQVKLETTAGELITSIILFCTFVVGILYTWATYKLLKEARLQSQLHVAPVLVVKCDNNGVFAKNIGKGHATSIHIKAYGCLSKDNSVDNYRHTFDPVPLFEVGSEHKLSYTTHNVGTGKNLGKVPTGGPDLINALLQAPHGKYALTLKILHRNVLNIRYLTEIKMDKDGITDFQTHRFGMWKKLTASECAR